MRDLQKKLAARRDWYRRNREHSLEYAKKYVQANPVDKDRVRIAKQAAYMRNKQNPEWVEKRREYVRLYTRKRRSSPEGKAYAVELNRQARKRDVIPFLVRGARARANKKSIPFDLTIEWARTKYTGMCELTGIQFRQSDGSQNPFSPSLDKINPELGYIKGNCRFILAGLNFMKGSGSDLDMYAIALALINHRRS